MKLSFGKTKKKIVWWVLDFWVIVGLGGAGVGASGLVALVAVAKPAGFVKGGDQLPAERPLRDGARDKCSPRPPFTGIISTLLICCSIHIHTRLP